MDRAADGRGRDTVLTRVRHSPFGRDHRPLLAETVARVEQHGRGRLAEELGPDGAAKLAPLHLADVLRPAQRTA